MMAYSENPLDYPLDTLALNVEFKHDQAEWRYIQIDRDTWDGLSEDDRWQQIESRLWMQSESFPSRVVNVEIIGSLDGCTVLRSARHAFTLAELESKKMLARVWEQYGDLYEYLCLMEGDEDGDYHFADEVKPSSVGLEHEVHGEQQNLPLNDFMSQ